MPKLDDVKATKIFGVKSSPPFCGEHSFTASRRIDGPLVDATDIRQFTFHIFNECVETSNLEGEAEKCRSGFLRKSGKCVPVNCW